MMQLKYTLLNDLEGFFYEIWWRDDIISDIQTTVSMIQGSIPSVLTSPPELDPYKTYSGISCDSTCSTNYRSCAGLSTNCILGWDFTASYSGFYNLSNPKYLSASGYHCSSYDYTTNICSGCVSNLTLSNNSCGCISGQTLKTFYTSFICITDIISCLTYHYYQGCYNCDTYYVYCPSTPCINSDKVCVADCPTGYYKDNTSPSSCKACETNCGACTTSTNCTACINNTYLKLADCVASCGTGYYQDTINMTCIQCPNAGCNTCRNFSYLLEGTCVNSCGIGYFQYGIDRVCIKCSANCSTCSDTGCTQCMNNTYLKSGLCVASCGTGYYQDTTNMTCIQCSSGCESCSYTDGSSICSACLSGYFLKNESCTQICGVGYFQDTNTMACIQCSANCNVCQYSFPIMLCTECESSHFLKEDLCVSECDSGNYINTVSNNDDKSPNYVCLKSLGFRPTAEMNESGIIILSFNAELITSLSYSSLVFKIQDKSYISTYFTISEIEINRVYSIYLDISLLGISSLTLSLIDPSSIVSVEYAYLEENEITISVPVEIRCDSTNICEICPEICRECVDNQCTMCEESYFLLDSYCVSECPSGYYNDIIGNKCVSCGIIDCIYCELNLESPSPVCLECSEDSILIDIGNTPNCLKYSSGTELGNELCTQCDSSCNKYIGQLACNVCLENTEILNSECVFDSDSLNLDTQHIKLLSASLKYISDNDLKLSFEIPLRNDLTKESISLYVNDIIYNIDKLDLKKDHSSSSDYIITLQEFDHSIDNTVTIFFSRETFPNNQVSNLYKILLYIPFQDHSESSDSDNNTETQYTQQEIALAEQFESISNGLAIASSVGTAVSTASGETNGWSLLSCIQIFSFMSLLQVDMPLILKSYLKAQESYYPAYDLFQDVIDNSTRPFKKAREFKYQTSNFILNSGKPIFILSLIILLNITSKISIRFLKGKLQTILENVDKKFLYAIYLRFLIQMYTEFSVPALLQLLYVILIQPQQETAFNIMTYILAMIISVKHIQAACLILPIFIMKFLYFNYSDLLNDELEPKWGALYSDFRTSKLAVQFYVLYFIRRLILALSFIFLRGYPLIQIIICSIACLIVITI